MRHLLIAVAVALLSTVFLTPHLTAQDENRPGFVVFTKTYWNFDMGEDEGSPEQWEALEKEYLEKVTEKNEHIMSTVMLNHYYTDNNSEVILVSTYKTWADIEAAQDRNSELEEAAWPDKAARDKFFADWDKYYVNKHSDEIYRTIPGAKLPTTSMGDSSMVVYIQKAQLAFPEDGTMDEFNALRVEYAQKVIHKNPYLKAYYPLRHAWGADNREMVHIYVVGSLCDVEQMNMATADLIKQGWPDEKARMEFMDKYNKYFTGRHGDYIYRSQPGVSK